MTKEERETEKIKYAYKTGLLGRFRGDIQDHWDRIERYWLGRM